MPQGDSDIDPARLLQRPQYLKYDMVLRDPDFPYWALPTWSKLVMEGELPNLSYLVAAGREQEARLGAVLAELHRLATGAGSLDQFAKFKSSHLTAVKKQECLEILLINLLLPRLPKNLFTAPADWINAAVHLIVSLQIEVDAFVTLTKEVLASMLQKRKSLTERANNDFSDVQRVMESIRLRPIDQLSIRLQAAGGTSVFQASGSLSAGVTATTGGKNAGSTSLAGGSSNAQTTANAGGSRLAVKSSHPAAGGTGTTMKASERLKDLKSSHAGKKSGTHRRRRK